MLSHALIRGMQCLLEALGIRRPSLGWVSPPPANVTSGKWNRKKEQPGRIINCPLKMFWKPNSKYSRWVLYLLLKTGIKINKRLPDEKKKMVTSWNLEKDKSQVQTAVELIQHCLGKGCWESRLWCPIHKLTKHPSDPVQFLLML